MAKMDNLLYHLKKSCRKITGTVTGIATDDHKKSGIPQGRRNTRGITLQPFRELEGNPLSPRCF